MKRIYFLAIIFLLNYCNLFAQPRFGNELGNLNYRDNELLINPATLGSVDRYLISLGVNKQWTGIEGSPLSETLQFQTPLAENSGLGAWLYNESYGPQNNTQFAAVYTYKLKMGKNTLSFGLSGAALMMSEKQVAGNDPDDHIFASNRGTRFGFNAGFGTYYFGNKFYAGFSIPQILTNDFETGVSDPKIKNSLDFGRMQYYFTGGYCFDVSEKISIKPTALIVVSGTTDLGFEGMLFASYKSRYEVGAGIASHTNLRITAGVAITANIAARYQYSQNLGSNYNRVGGSHFVVLKFNFGKKKITE